MAELSSKPVEGKVSNCPCCGAEFSDKASANEWHDCGECLGKFKVSVK